MLPVSHQPTETTNSFRIMATHPICDLAATDDQGSQKGHLKSNEVTIHFSPISHDRIKIKMHKWLGSSSRFRRYAYWPTLVMTWTSPDLNWGQILKFTFQWQKVHFLSRSTRQIWWYHFYFCVSHIKKVINKYHLCENDNFWFDDLWGQNHWP